MTLEGIVSGDYGQVVELTVVDIDTDEATDLSGYTSSQKMILLNPVGTETEKSAAFVTDGSDGKVQYTLANGDINAVGVWKMRVRVTSGAARLTSRWTRFVVEE